MEKKIVIYTTKICPWCDKVKEFLKEHKIEFEEIDVSKNKRAAVEMIKKSGQTGVPVIEIKKAHSVGMIIGFDEERLRHVLGIKREELK